MISGVYSKNAEHQCGDFWQFGHDGPKRFIHWHVLLRNRNNCLLLRSCLVISYIDQIMVFVLVTIVKFCYFAEGQLARARSDKKLPCCEILGTNIKRLSEWT